jgi:hypothetical protein
MKKVALLLFLASLVSQAAGCIFVSDDDDDSADVNDNNDITDDVTDDVTDDGGEAVIDVSWMWQEVAANGALSPTSCPPNADISLHTQEVDANNNPIGQEIIDIYDCDVGTAVTPPLPPGRVSTFLSGTSDVGTFTSFLQLTDLTTTNQVVDFELINNGGYIVFSWDLVGQSGAALNCEDVAEIDGVGIISTSVTTSSIAFDDQYECTDYYGTTSPLPADNYTVAVDAFNAANESLVTDPVTRTLTVGALNDLNQELGTALIEIAGR